MGLNTVVRCRGGGPGGRSAHAGVGLNTGVRCRGGGQGGGQHAGMGLAEFGFRTGVTTCRGLQGLTQVTGFALTYVDLGSGLDIIVML